MSNKPYRILITRPEVSGQQLASTLTDAGYFCHCQPLFTYQQNADSTQLEQHLITQSPDSLIFVSAAAVDYAQQIKPIMQWGAKRIFAIGKATKERLNCWGINEVIAPENETSEGLLELADLTDLKNENITIVRGDGGREKIATTLTQRGASVHYFESYRKKWLPIPEQILIQWQQLQINCLIITSNALLESVVQLIKKSDKYWQNTCLWIVASERIADNAHQLGINNVICSYGANDEAILTCLRTLAANNGTN